MNFQEVLGAISTVVSFNDEEGRVKKYSELLWGTWPQAKRRACAMGLGVGLLLFCMFGIVYAIGLWYGATLVADDELTVGDMFGVFFAFIMAGMAFGQLGSVVGDITGAQAAAIKAFRIIDREPRYRKIVKQSSTGKEIEGYIDFKDVYFTYPTRKEAQVLNGLNLSVTTTSII